MSENYLHMDKSSDVIGPMFDSIAHSYDFLNHFLSFGIDRRWRRKAIRIIEQRYHNPVLLDVATGTGDMAVEASRISSAKITGIDISEKMLEAGRNKIRKKRLEERIELIAGDSQNIGFEDNTFDAAVVAFGVRNFPDPVRGLTEMRRVIHPGGMVVVLEFSRPDTFIFKHVYNIYFRYILPLTGALISGRRKAYRYLNQSVMEFADKEQFIQMMNDAGLDELSQTRLTLGIATIYTGIKK